MCSHQELVMWCDEMEQHLLSASPFPSLCVHVCARFPEEFDITSSHKLRSTGDMQFSFSYFYYMMSEPAELDNSTLFGTYDTDETG